MTRGSRQRCRASVNCRDWCIEQYEDDKIPKCYAKRCFCTTYESQMNGVYRVKTTVFTPVVTTTIGDETIAQEDVKMIQNAVAIGKQKNQPRIGVNIEDEVEITTTEGSIDTEIATEDMARIKNDIAEAAKPTPEVETTVSDIIDNTITDEDKKAIMDAIAGQLSRNSKNNKPSVGDDNGWTSGDPE